MQAIVLQGIMGCFPWQAMVFFTLWLQLNGFSNATSSLLVATFGAGVALVRDTAQPKCMCVPPPKVTVTLCRQQMRSETQQACSPVALHCLYPQLLTHTWALCAYAVLSCTCWCVVLAAAAQGALVGGSIGDRMARRMPNNGRIFTAQISVFCGIPLTWLILKGLPASPYASTPVAYGFFMFVMGTTCTWVRADRGAVGVHVGCRQVRTTADSADHVARTRALPVSDAVLLRRRLCLCCRLARAATARYLQKLCRMSCAAQSMLLTGAVTEAGVLVWVWEEGVAAHGHWLQAAYTHTCRPPV